MGAAAPVLGIDRVPPGCLLLPPDEHPHLDVVQRRELAEQLDVLEGPGNAGLGHLVRAVVGDVRVVQVDAPVVGVVELVDAVQQARLAGAVRADQRDEFVLLDLEVDAVERQNVAEPFGDVLRAQDDLSCGIVRFKLPLPSWIAYPFFDCHRLRLR